MVYFDQLLGAVLCRRLCIPTSSCVLLTIHFKSYYDTTHLLYLQNIIQNCNFFVFSSSNTSPGPIQSKNCRSFWHDCCPQVQSIWQPCTKNHVAETERSTSGRRDIRRRNILLHDGSNVAPHGRVRV